MSKKRIILIVVALAVVALVGRRIMVAQRESRIRRSYYNASLLVRDGKYQEAADIYAKLGDEEKLAECNEALAREAAMAEAQALLDAGKPGEAMERLEGWEELTDRSYVNARLYFQAVNARAAELLEQGDAGEALALLKRVDPDNALVPACEQAADEQQFQALLDAGDPDAARDLLKAIENRNASTQRLSDAGLEELRLALTRAEAADKLAKGDYDKAFTAYKALSDEPGMRAALDAMEAAGQFKAAFRHAVQMGDIPRADGLLDRAAAESGMVFERDGELVYGDALSALAAGEGEGETALAQRIADGTVEACRALIDGGARSVPYRALADLKECAEGLWTEEWQALMDGCVEEMPENGTLRESWTDPSPDSGGGTATITVFTGKRAAILKLAQTTKPDLNDRSDQTGNYIFAFVRPGQRYVFSVPAGYYSAYVTLGRIWFGIKEGFGYTGSSESVSIGYNYYHPEKGRRLEGSYSLTVE